MAPQRHDTHFQSVLQLDEIRSVVPVIWRFEDFAVPLIGLRRYRHKLQKQLWTLNGFRQNTGLS